MNNTATGYLLAPVLGFFATWALIIVVHLARLEINERRRNRRLARKRAELGLSPS